MFVQLNPIQDIQLGEVPSGVLSNISQEADYSLGKTVHKICGVLAFLCSFGRFVRVMRS